MVRVPAQFYTFLSYTHEVIKASEKRLHNTESQCATDNRSNNAQQTTSHNIIEDTNIADAYHPVKRIHRKRHTAEGQIEYYVSWRNRPKKDNTWLPETHLSDSLQEKGKTLKIPETIQQSRMAAYKKNTRLAYSYMRMLYKIRLNISNYQRVT